MPNDLSIAIERQVTVTEQRTVTLKELSILAATPAQPGVIAVVLANKTPEGEWAEDAAPLLVRKVDDRDSKDPREAQAASMFHELIFSAIVSDTPLHQMLGVAGMSVWDAAKAILGQELKS